MDDLVDHCLKELAFDGDLGSDVSRLYDFVQDFYAISSQEQVLDDNFYAFAWSLVVQHPTVRVGVKPDGLVTEVYIAPQQSARRKAQAKGEEIEDTPPPELAIIDNAELIPLAELREQCHDDLRIAIHPESVLAAITGTHIRSPKLSPMVYSALQLIARGREEGLSVTSLGQTSGYDQKTCFYLVKQLTELDLVVKVRRGGVGSNFCIHKHFYNRSPLWRQIREEEHEAEEKETPQEGLNAGADEPSQYPSVAKSYGFTPIDSRHLSSLTLLRSRMTKLLTSSQNNMFPAMNIMFYLGFSNPSHTDRRFFQRRMRELVNMGVVEKVVVPSNNRRSGSASVVKCYRLVSDEPHPEGNNALQLAGDDEDDFEDDDSSSLKVNVTLHKQFTNIIEESALKGLTLNEISTSLGDFDKRTIELLLTRAEKYPPPPHLRDLGIKDILETFGRERRYRYLTTAFYETLINQQTCGDDGNKTVAIFTQGFLQLDESLFYENSTHLHDYQDTFKAPTADLSKKRSTDTELSSRPKKRRKTHVDECADLPSASRKRKRDHEGQKLMTDNGSAVTSNPPEPKRRGKPPKPKDDAANTPKKRGRPPKHRDAASATDTMNLQAAEHEAPSVAKQDALGPAQEIEHTESPNAVPTGASTSLSSAAPRRSSRRQSARKVDSAECTPAAGGGSRNAHLDVSSCSRRTAASQEAPMSAPSSIDGRSPARGTRDNSVSSQLSMDPPPVTTIPESARSLISNSNKHSRSKGPKVNVSALRREQEFLRLLNLAGGIVNTSSKEIFSLHEEVLRSLEATGEPTSTLPGTKIDKRTLRATFANMESRGLVKTISTAISGPTGLSRPVYIVYKAEVPQHQVDTFILNLEHSTPAPRPEKLTVLEEDLAYGAGPDLASSLKPPNLSSAVDSKPRITSQDRKVRTVNQANHLFQQDDNTIREALLTERSTVSQLYGYIMGKARRAMKLHLLAIAAFDTQCASQHVVSSETRIISLSYLHYDITVEDFCALVAVTAVSQELGAYLSSPEARKTPLHELPEKLRSDLHLSRARAKSRLLELMEVLRLLGLAVPLKVSTSSSPYATCSPQGNHPTLYDIAVIDDNTVPSNAPLYWQFTNLTALHRWAISRHSPPFVKNIHTGSISECEMYWAELQECSLSEPSPGAMGDVADDVHHGNEEASSLGRILQRSKSWACDYSLTWYQTRYLQSLVDASTGNTPLQSTSQRDELQRIAHVCSAPEGIVASYFNCAREKVLAAMSKASERGSRQKVNTPSQNVEEGAQVRLAQLAADANRQREQDWEDLLQTIHPDPVPAPLAAKFGRMRHRFIASAFGKDDPKWAEEMEQTIRETHSIGQQLPRPLRKAAAAAAAAAHHPLANTPAPAVTINPPVKSVQELILQQKKLLAIQPVKPTAKRKAKESRRTKGEDTETRKPSMPATRRTRFQWNRDYEELAQDAYAIVRARCRPHHRVDFTAFEQVFPALLRNSVRQHVVASKNANGNDAYLQRLEESWYEFWLRYRGTDVLPDVNPSSISDFDLACHIEVLRKHIDKTALRVGFYQSSLLPQIILPDCPETMGGSYTIEEASAVTPCYDFIWNALKEESREVSLLQQAFVRDQEDLTTLLQSATQCEDRMQIAEGALKMVMGTPEDRYTPEAGSTLLADFEKDTVEQATKNLLSKNVLSKLVRDPSADRPGRQLKINEVNQNALGGSLAQDLFQDASALEYSSAHQVDIWRCWPLLSSDGDITALLQLASEEKVEFTVNVSVSRNARDELDWNSKKTGDDDLETDVSVRFHDIASPDDVQPNDSSNERTPPALLTESSPHGFTDTGDAACCSREGAEIADCTGCLHNSTSLLMQTEEGDKEAVAALHAVLYNSGSNGTPAYRLESIVPDSARIISRMLAAFPTPLCLWAGYQEQVLVHTAFMRSCTVLVSDEPLIRIQPKRWRDVNGAMVNNVWAAACRAVVGVVAFRPGVSLTEIRWRLRSVYDRQEVHELVLHLSSEGIIERRAISDSGDDANTFYFLGGQRSWYHLP